MASKRQTAVDYFFDKIKSNFEHDGDKLESVTFLYAICKEKEREQIENAYWDGGQDVPINPDRCKQYYEQTYGTNKLNKKQNERIIGNNNTF